MKSTFAFMVGACLTGIALADFKIVQVDSYPAFGGSYGGTTATQAAVATAGGDTPSCDGSASDGFSCDGCGFVKNNDGTEGDGESGLTSPFTIVGDGGGDFCEIPQLTCTTNDSDGYDCIRDDDGSFQATCYMDPGFNALNCDNIDGTSAVSAFLACAGPACG